MSGDVELPLAGGCACGAVRFEVTAPLGNANYCHCTRCQRRTGTASSAQALVDPASLRILAGEDLIKTWKPAGGGFRKQFCGECGSALFSADEETGAVATVRLGAIDGDPGVRPRLRQFVGYAAPWEPIPDDGLPRHAERRPVP
jgi:hypothetical protein